MTAVAPVPSPYVNDDAPAKDLISRCVHCGLCLPTCPTFAVLGLEADSPRGRIRLMKTVWEGGIDPKGDAFALHIDRCLDCRACETACPSGVEFGKLVEGARSQIALTRRVDPISDAIARLAFNVLLVHKWPLATFAWFGFVAKKIGVGAVLRAIPPLRGLGEMLRMIPDRAPSSTELPPLYEARGEKRGRIALFTGCVMSAAFADTNAATARVFARNGVEVAVPRVQTCCGALHAHAGRREDSRALARENIAALERLDVDAIVVNAAGCGAHLKEYGWLLKDDPAWAERAEHLAARVRDAGEHLAAVGLRETPGTLAGTIAYDDPCHLIHGQKIREQPRELLQAIPGITLVPLPESDWCCGSAGVYNITQPEIARTLGDRKAGKIRESGADTVVTANPGCLMQIEAGLRRAGDKTEVIHLMDLLDRAYADGR